MSTMKPPTAGGRLTLCALAVLTLSLVACGGGGGGSSGGGSGGSSGGGTAGTVTGTAAAPSTGPGDTSALFPSAVGSVWLYDGTDSAMPGQASLETVTVTGTTTVKGATVAVFHVTDSVGDTPFDQYYAASAGGVTDYGNSDTTDTMTNALVPAPALLFPAMPGTISHVVATNLPDGAGVVANADQVVQVVGTESVTVGAGVFPNAVKVVVSVTGAVTDTGTGQIAPATGTDARWYAPGVGLVQETVTTGNDVETYAARGYTIAGVAHALDAPLALPGVSDGSYPLEQAFGAGTLLTTHQAVTDVTATATLSDLNGQVLATLSLPQADGRTLVFDGTNYARVGFGRTPQGAPGLAIQHVSTAGVALDGAPSTHFLVTSLDNASLTSESLLAGGGQLLLLYSQFDGADWTLYGLLANNDGTVAAGATPFKIRTGVATGSVVGAFDGSHFLVVWQDAGLSTGTPQGSTIMALRVSAAGVPDAAPLVLSAGGTFTSMPAVAFDGSHFVATWADGVIPYDQQRIADDFSTSQIWARRIDTDGSLLDGVPGNGGIAVATTSGHGRSAPAVAFTGSECLVTWTDHASAPTFVQAARIAPDGTLRSGAGYEIRVGSMANESFVRVTATGAGAAWIDWFDGTALQGVRVHPF
jgi:hypothetical protein